MSPFVHVGEASVFAGSFCFNITELMHWLSGAASGDPSYSVKEALMLLMNSIHRIREACCRLLLLSIAVAVAAFAMSVANPSLADQAVTASTGVASNEYRLGVGDKIEIDVYNEADLTVIATVSESGTIAYPFLGDIKIAGISVKEVAQIVTTGLKGSYLVDPVVSVSIVQYRPFFIQGEVKQSGGYPYQPGLTVRKAVSLAGGLTDRASQSRITVIHENDEHRKSIPISIDDPVHPGDTITIEQSFF